MNMASRKPGQPLKWSAAEFFMVVFAACINEWGVFWATKQFINLLIGAGNVSLYVGLSIDRSNTRIRRIISYLVIASILVRYCLFAPLSPYAMLPALHICQLLALEIEDIYLHER